MTSDAYPTPAPQTGVPTQTAPGAGPEAAVPETSTGLPPATTAWPAYSPPGYAIAGYPAPAAYQPAATPGPATDRWWVHLIWDGILLVLVLLGLAVLWLFQGSDLLLDDPLLVDRLYLGAPLLLLATALALSIRVRAANLAVGAVAALTVAILAEWGDGSPLLAAGLVVLAAVLTGLVLAGLVAGLRLPGWAVSLVATLPLAVVAGVVAGREVGVTLVFPVSSYFPTSGVESLAIGRGAAGALVLTVVAVSIAGGVIGILPPVRRLLGRCREAAAGPGPRSVGTALATGAALLVSCLLAAGAGVLLMLPLESGLRFQFHAGGYEPVGLAFPLAIVLLGGTSLGGKRGGVLGTFLAGLLLFVVILAIEEGNLPPTAGYWVMVAAVMVGLVVSWLAELLGRGPAAGSVQPGLGPATMSAPTTWPAPATMPAPATPGQETVDQGTADQATAARMSSETSKLE